LITLGEALKATTESLLEVSDTPNLDAQTLLVHRSGKSRAWILAHPEEGLTESIHQIFHRDIEKLKKGVPLPYVLGEWEFYGLDFILTPDTLIPRPETELLIEQAVYWHDRHSENRQVADIGTGSGCIAVTLAKLKPSSTIIATDISYAALRVARENSIHHNVTNRVHLMQADLLPPVANRFDLICANLPYIPNKVLRTLEVSQGEPILALDGGPTGLDLIGRFLERAPDQIAPGGCLLLEIEDSQGSDVQRLAHRAFPSAEISVLKDLAGHDRLVTIQLLENS
jgi:release factor glutamine methyltransferase